MLVSSLAICVLCPSLLAQVSPLEYNRAELVMMAVQGKIAHAVLRDPPYRVTPDGALGVYPGVGGITYNFRTGDSAVNIAADHVEPAVTVYSLDHNKDRNGPQNVAFNVLSCIGNEAIVISGDAKGARGWVIGKHGGAEHVMVDFPAEVYDDLAIEDVILIKSIGTGMKLLNIDGVAVMNMSPLLMKAMTRAGAGVTADGTLRVPVTHRVPAKIMGSGLGRNHVYKGDYDIQLYDEKVVAEHNLNTLRFGDIVAIIDADHTYGRIYRTGAVSIGVVVHSRSWTAGLGPGVTTLFSSKEGKIESVIDPNANLAQLLGIR